MFIHIIIPIIITIIIMISYMDYIGRDACISRGAHRFGSSPGSPGLHRCSEQLQTEQRLDWFW